MKRVFFSLIIFYLSHASAVIVTNYHCNVEGSEQVLFYLEKQETFVWYANGFFPEVRWYGYLEDGDRQFLPSIKVTGEQFSIEVDDDIQNIVNRKFPNLQNGKIIKCAEIKLDLF